MIKVFLFVLLFPPIQMFAQSLRVTHLQCEYKDNPSGIEVAFPKLSWELQSTARNITQTAYRILVADNIEDLNKGIGNEWGSKRTISSASIQISYRGKPLTPSKTYYWKVMAWDNQGHVSGWSSTAQWQMGLPSQVDWGGAKWIAYKEMADSMWIVPAIHGRGPKKLNYANDTLPLMRKTFAIDKPVKKATIYICGLGQFDLSLNGAKVGDHFLDPGWTKYDKQALYVPFDITKQLVQGNNTIGVMLGNGFYYIPRDKRYRKLTGAYGYPKLICRLVIEYMDGVVKDIVSDESWKTAPGPITFTSIYAGEDYNANLEQKGWDASLFDDSKWRNVVVLSDLPHLSAQIADPVKIFERFEPVKCTSPAPGALVYDLGQNASGIPFIKVKGKKGDTVKIIPAELLNADGTANQKGSGGPVYFNYILKGDGVETWQPQFSYYGFRYLQIDGVATESDTNPKNLPIIIKAEGLHIRNAAARIGDFTCSNELFNRTFSLIDWAMQSNMMSVFTDCPHREKLGWLEEVHLLGSSLRYNYDIANLCRKNISDMKIAQTPDGLIPEIAPEFVKFENPFRDSPEWGSNAVIMPWYVYQWYGDKEDLAHSYDMIKRYLSYLNKKADKHILLQGLGDWYDLGPKRPGFSQNTPNGITATAIYYYDLNIASKIARLLGKTDDAAGYQNLAQQVRTAFNHTFFDAAAKQYGSGSQTANAMAVYMKLVEPGYKDAVVANIVKDIRDRGNSLTAGDIGYRYLLRVLEDEGHSDVIFDMNSRSDVPGYGYQLAKGATALTESWQALPTVSNDHFMLGHIMEWFYSGLAGIRSAPNAIAMKSIEIRPEPIGDVTFAKANYKSPYGNISANWKKKNRSFELTAQIPVNTSALIYLPAEKNSSISESGKHIESNKEIKLVGFKNGRAIIRVGSGLYHFVAAKH